MKRGMRFTLGTLVLLALILAGSQGVMASDDVRIVKLVHNIAAGESYQIPFLVEPEILTVRPGTVVVWVNDGAYEVSVSFDDAKKCQGATRDPGGDFKLDEAQTCLLTVVMANGGTKSLKFADKGVYEYKVKWANQPKEYRGKVVVY